ncbi:MAG: PIN domain-containing protein [Thermoplasmatales archaeon]|nr:PIN domain-containing protein [Thermoplasmatales archaeon]
MRLVVDTNILLSALIKKSATRKILLHPGFEFYAPEHIFYEIENHKNEVIKKSGLSEEEFYIVLDSVLTNAIITPENEFAKYIPRAWDIMKNIDPDDFPFLALALSFENDGIWTNDKHFFRQKEVKVWRTKDLLKKI